MSISLDRSHPKPGLAAIGDFGAKLKSLALRWFGKDVEGFREHGWTGKLFLMIAGSSSLSATVALPIAFLTGRWGAATFEGPGTWKYLLLFGGVSLWFSWSFVRGIARFHRGWDLVAILFAGVGLIGGIAQMLRGGGLPLVVDVAQTALSAQFLWYFVRNRHRFVTSLEVEMAEWRETLPPAPEPTA